MEVKKLQITDEKKATVVFTLNGKLIKAVVVEEVCDGELVHRVHVLNQGTVVTISSDEVSMGLTQSSVQQSDVVANANSIEPVVKPMMSNFTPARCVVDQPPALEEHELVLKSPLAGLVVKVKVAVGQFVTKNQPVVVIESMKMENEICAPFPAFIKKLSISEGNLVKPNQVIVTFERRGGSGDAATKKFNDQEAFER